MARGINKVILVGVLGRDPEVRYTSNGKTVATVSIATSESWKDRVTGEKQERTEWHSLVFFGPLADIVSKYLKKGSQVYVEGALRTEKYTDKQGVEKYSTKIHVNEMQMLGGKADASDLSGTNFSDNSQFKPNNSPKNTAPSSNQTPAPQQYEPFNFDQSDDDDLPF